MQSTKYSSVREDYLVHTSHPHPFLSFAVSGVSCLGNHPSFLKSFFQVYPSWQQILCVCQDPFRPTPEDSLAGQQLISLSFLSTHVILSAGASYPQCFLWPPSRDSASRFRFPDAVSRCTFLNVWGMWIGVTHKLRKFSVIVLSTFTSAPGWRSWKPKSAGSPGPAGGAP
jgi:hypothetical protein